MPTDPRTDPLRFAHWVPNVSGGLVQYNDGFRTQLIGTPEQVARRIVEYRDWAWI